MPATTEKYRAVAYEGVMWMPETTNAVYTFAVSFADVAAIWIDGSLVVFREGSKSYSDGTYFHEFASVELSPGPHAFRALLSHKKTGSWGPKSIDAPDTLGVVWEDNMGLAWRVGTPDPSAPTNSATFLKFVDSGDGSLLSTAALPTLAALVEDPSRFRASFDALSFSAGTALDLAAPDLPQVVLTVPVLEGFPVISNGSFRVSGTWSADLESQPDGALVLGESAELSFGASALLDLVCSGSVSDLKGRVIARGPVGAILNGPAEVRVNGKSGRWRTVVETVGGTSCLTLERVPSGMLLLFR